MKWHASTNKNKNTNKTKISWHLESVTRASACVCARMLPRVRIGPSRKALGSGGSALAAVRRKVAEGQRAMVMQEQPHVLLSS